MFRFVRFCIVLVCILFFVNLMQYTIIGDGNTITPIYTYIFVVATLHQTLMLK